MVRLLSPFLSCWNVVVFQNLSPALLSTGLQSAIWPEKKRKTLGVVHLSRKREKNDVNLKERISFGAKKCNERYSFLPDGWMDGWIEGGKKILVFRLVVDVIRHHQERR